ncbi:MAG TPA: hypothetical protein VNA88_15900 [Candidatus Kapabacteria bacterium]|nr:hypothetical protein [Candidatus Kapabacteria bacterium]
MNRAPLTRSALRVTLAVAAIIALVPAPSAAQFDTRPSLGIQTMLFNGDNQARRPISQGTDVMLAFGGGLSSANNGIRFGLEVVPDPEGVLRFPIVAEYYWFDGKTTFAVPSNNRRVQQLRLHYTANMFSGGLGVTASFFNKAVASLYFSAEGRFNYFPSTTLTSRRFYLDNGELIGAERSITPDTEARTRIGAVIRMGTQADFFDPVLLDFTIGYGALNLGMKDTDPETQRDLLTAEPTLNTAERTLGFITFGLSAIWRF